MKKYVKPELFYEKFELSQHIASCSGIQLNHTDESCNQIKDGGGLDYAPGTVVFRDGDCAVPFPEGYCYTNGSDGYSIFGS